MFRAGFRSCCSEHSASVAVLPVRFSPIEIISGLAIKLSFRSNEPRSSVPPFRYRNRSFLPCHHVYVSGLPSSLTVGLPSRWHRCSQLRPVSYIGSCDLNPFSGNPLRTAMPIRRYRLCPQNSFPARSKTSSARSTGNSRSNPRRFRSAKSVANCCASS